MTPTPPTIETEQRARLLAEAEWLGEFVAANTGLSGHDWDKRHRAQKFREDLEAALSTQDVGVERAARKIIDCYGVGWGFNYQGFTKAVGPFIMELREALASTPPQPEQEGGFVASEDLALIRAIAVKHIPGWPLEGDLRADVERALLEAAGHRPAAQPVDEGQVWQEIREAAATYYDERNLPVSARCAREGRNDHDPLIRAFAHVIIASRSRALEEAKAAVRESLFPQNDRSDWTAYAEHRAEACEQAEAAIDLLIQSSQGGDNG